MLELERKKCKTLLKQNNDIETSISRVRSFNFYYRKFNHAITIISLEIFVMIDTKTLNVDDGKYPM